MVGFAGSLADKGFPGNISCNLWVAVTVSNPADYCVRVNGDGISGKYVAQYNGISVRKNSDIGIVSFCGKGGGSKSLLGKDTHSNEAHAVVAVSGKGP